MSQPFAIITFRDTGPIKSWAAMRGAEIHNARTKPIAHGDESAPRPQFLIGSPAIVNDARTKLRAAGIDPNRLRKNGVIAYEAVLTASPEFFAAGSEVEQAKRLDEWTRAQTAWAVEQYGHHRIVSLVLHVDEKTPHVHLIVLPLEPKYDRRRTLTKLEWGLVGRTISGPGRFDEVQDAYAGAMAAFGLRRGARGSGRKHEPMKVYLARLAQSEENLKVREANLIMDRLALDDDRASLQREKFAVFETRKRLELEAAALEKARSDQESEAAADRLRRDQEFTRIAREKLNLAKEADAVGQTREKVAGEIAHLKEMQQHADADQEAARAERQHNADYRAQLERHQQIVSPAIAAAKDFMAKLEAVKGRPLVADAAIARAAAGQLYSAVRRPSEHAAIAPSPAVLAQMQAQRSGLNL